MLSKIRAASNGLLRKSEQRVAKIVLETPETVLKTPIATLAQQAGVSEPTVMRFCQALGCDGFQEFKLRLAQDLAAQVHYAHQHIGTDDSANSLAEKVIDGAIASLVQLRQQLEGATLSAAIQLLLNARRNARRIEIYGLGGAGIVAADAQLKFSRLGIASMAYSDAYIHNVSASLLKPGDVVVALSNSGRSKDLLRSVELALNSGAKVLAITASGSPLAGLATLTLTVDIGDAHDEYAPIKARITPMVMIDILAIGIALESGNEMIERLANMQNILQEKFL